MLSQVNSEVDLQWNIFKEMNEILHLFKFKNKKFKKKMLWIFFSLRVKDSLYCSVSYKWRKDPETENNTIPEVNCAFLCDRNQKTYTKASPYFTRKSIKMDTNLILPIKVKWNGTTVILYSIFCLYRD